MDEPASVDKTVEEIWRSYLMTGDVPDGVDTPWYMSKRLRALVARLPSAPRCRLCYYPFEGIGGKVTRSLLRIRPSRMNPLVCNNCERFAQEFQGGAEVETSLLFADVRGSTTMAETMSARQFSRLIRRFYDVTMRVLIYSNAFIEKLMGDQVTGYYVPGFAGPNHAQVAIDAARSILHATGHHDPSGPWVPVGVGIHTGTAYIGAVHSEAGVTDIAVLGDVANVGARLASEAAPGEVVISEAARAAAGLDAAGLDFRRLQLKGRSEPVDSWVVGSSSHLAEQRDPARPGALR